MTYGVQSPPGCAIEPKNQASGIAIYSDGVTRCSTPGSARVLYSDPKVGGPLLHVRTEIFRKLRYGGTTIPETLVLRTNFFRGTKILRQAQTRTEQFTLYTVTSSKKITDVTYVKYAVFIVLRIRGSHTQNKNSWNVDQSFPPEPKFS